MATLIPIIPCCSYLWFLAEEPQLVLGFAQVVFGVRPWSCPALLLPVSFRRVADGPVRAGSAQILAEVLKRVVSRRVKAGLERLHHDGRVLGQSEDRKQLTDKRPAETSQARGLGGARTRRSSTALAAVIIPSRHLEMIGMTLCSASAKLWYVSPSFTVRRSSMACRFCSPEREGSRAETINQIIL